MIFHKQFQISVHLQCSGHSETIFDNLNTLSYPDLNTNMEGALLNSTLTQRGSYLGFSKLNRDKLLKFILSED